MSYVEISQGEYQKYKKKWVEAIPQDPTVPNAFLPVSYFEQGTDLIYGYKIAKNLRDDLRNMSIDNTLFTNVGFSFVIDDNNKVKIALFGISKINNDPLTPYYLLNEPITQPPVIKIPFTGLKQQILEKEAKEWTGAWRHELNSGKDLNATLFHVTNLTIGEASKLQNYTFALKEVADKITFLATDKEVNVYFAINKYPNPLNPDASSRDLFSLVVEWNHIDETIADSYYDVSYPCPPCCPACPS